MRSRATSERPRYHVTLPKYLHYSFQTSDSSLEACACAWVDTHVLRSTLSPHVPYRYVEVDYIVRYFTRSHLVIVASATPRSLASRENYCLNNIFISNAKLIDLASNVVFEMDFRIRKIYKLILTSYYFS